MGKNKGNTSSDVKTTVENFYGTKVEWVKSELDVKMGDIFGNDNIFNEKAVVAEDEKGLYVTGKSYVGSHTLDPFRLYKRIVPEVVTDENNNVSYKVNFYERSF